MKVSMFRVLCLLGAASGCASVAAPRERFANSQGDLRAAETVGADKVPKAALHLQLAREEIEKARKQMEAGQNECADYTLRRAQADAELAIAIAKNQPVSEKAEQAKSQLEKLKQQNAATQQD